MKERTEKKGGKEAGAKRVCDNRSELLAPDALG
jgi:hypothetical protein